MILTKSQNQQNSGDKRSIRFFRTGLNPVFKKLTLIRYCHYCKNYLHWYFTLAFNST